MKETVKIAKTEITNDPKKPKIILRFVKRSTSKIPSKQINKQALAKYSVNPYNMV